MQDKSQAMDQSGVLFYSLGDDKATASLKVDAKNMNAHELSDLIARLGMLRANMTPGIPVEVNEKDTTPIPVIDRMYFRHLADGQTAGVHGAVFVARSPLFGLQSFIATPEICRGLAAWLVGDKWSMSPPDALAH
jgi:hypothetical protein